MDQTRSEIEASILDELRGLEGRFWREVQGELQEGAGECAIWILLYEDSVPSESHDALCEILRPRMEAMAPVDFTVAYCVLTEMLETTVDTLMSNAEILAAWRDPALGKTRVSRARPEFSVFKHALSGNRPD
ncbi:MAG: hypothetical protein AAGH70_05790 [Pseudomonadota bacterium]